MGKGSTTERETTVAEIEVPIDGNRAWRSWAATEGPIVGDSTSATRYREITENDNANRHAVRSTSLGPNGERFEVARRVSARR